VGQDNPNDGPSQSGDGLKQILARVCEELVAIAQSASGCGAIEVVVLPVAGTRGLNAIIRTKPSWAVAKRPEEPKLS
jgi:hypothetical protein